MPSVDVCDNGQRIGVLKQPCAINDHFISFDDGDYQPTHVLIQALVEWRNNARRFFFDQREVTFDGTYTYLERAIANPTKHPMLICLPDGIAIGTYGYTREIDSADVELGNLIRGDSSGGRGFIHHVERALLRHLFDNGIQNVYADIFSDNANVIRLHERTGFKEVGCYPMQFIDGVYAEVNNTTAIPNQPARWVTRMVNTPRQFKAIAVF